VRYRWVRSRVAQEWVWVIADVDNSTTTLSVGRSWVSQSTTTTS